MQLERLPYIVGEAYKISGFTYSKPAFVIEAEADAIAKSEIGTPSRAVRCKQSDRTEGLTEGSKT